MRLAQQRRVGGGERAQLGGRGAEVGGDARVGEVLGARGRRPGGGAARSRSSRPRPRARRAAPRALRRRPPRARRARSSGAPPSRSSQTPRAVRAVADSPRRTRASSASAAAGSGSRPGVRSHGQQVGRRAAGQRRARARQHAGAEPRAPERHAAVVGDRDAVAGEHLGEQRGRARVAAQQHRDVRRLDPLAHELQHRGADELGLGALAARLEQPHRAVRRPAVGRRLEQRALEVVQRGPRAPARSAPSAPAGGRPRRRAGAAPRPSPRGRRTRRAPARTGARRRRRRPRDAAERLDRVALGRREVVEAVEEHGPPAPRGRVGAQRVERRPGVALLVRAPEPLQPPPVGRVERRELVRRRRRRPPSAAHVAQRGR